MSVPGPPIVYFQPRSRNQSLEYRWKPPANDGGSPITGYRFDINGLIVDLSGDLRYYKFTGLTNGTDYTTTICAQNANGFGATASFRTFQPGSSVPAPPSTVTAVAQGISSAVVSWTPPTTVPDSAIQWYTIIGVPTSIGASTVKVTGDGLLQTSYFFSNLTPSASYYFNVYAVNCPGYSAARSTNTITLTEGYITSNLTMFMDSRNATSYPGSGTTWSNLAPRYSTIHYTLNGVSRSTIVYNGTSNASMIFNGSGYIYPSASMQTMLDENSRNETREFWFYWTGTSGVFTSEEDNQTPADGWTDYQGYISPNNLIFAYWNGAYTTHTVSTGVTSNQWYHLVYQYSATSNLIMGYVNGVRTLSNGSSPRQFNGGAYYLFYGAPAAGASGQFSGAIPIIRYYNRILSSNEVVSNFSFQRTQFGV